MIKMQCPECGQTIDKDVFDKRHKHVEKKEKFNHHLAYEIMLFLLGAMSIILVLTIVLLVTV